MQKSLAVFLFACTQVLLAQTPARDLPGSNTPLERRLEQENFEKWALAPDAVKQAQAKKEAEAREQEFYEKAQRFVTLWAKFAKDLNEQKTFNAKLAKEISKAFHDMEKSDGWPVGRTK